MSADQPLGVGSPESLQDLSQLKRKAKELLRGFRASDAAASSLVEKQFDGADPNSFRLAQAQPVVARSLGFPSWTKLTVAAESGGGERPKRLPRAQPRQMVGTQYVYDVDPVDGDLAREFFEACRAGEVGKTPLHHYAGNGEVGNLELLLERGADIDAIDDEYHSTPLAWAAREGRVEAVRLLLAHGADFSASGGQAAGQGARVGTAG